MIDVNHIFTNDPSMQLAEDFYDQLEGRIAEWHVSGYDGYHEPFIQTKQENIIKAIQDMSIPIINYSVITPDLIDKERDYFLKILSK